jgi:succinate dehydrogenase / fumarate reductase, cytochrome b subunit
MSSLKTTFSGYSGYRGREGQIGFLLHRITGLGTVLFLAIHILDTSTVYFFPALYGDAINIYRSTLAGLGEIALIFCVFYHGVNGLRIAIFDLFTRNGWKISIARTSVRLTLAITLLFWIPSTVIMLRNLLINNFGLFGG